jgi:hypothetical protein
MKKTAIIAGATFLCFLVSSVTVNAQQPETKQVPQTTAPQTTPAPAQPEATVPEVQTQTTTTTAVPETSLATTTTVSKDRWNNWDKSKYAMLPMPEPLTTEKIFPAIGKYQVTTKDGATADVTVTLDESNKGIVWIEGLPEGKIKGYLRQSPATYKIPAQKTDADKDIASGVFVFDKDANTVNVCVGCTYKAEDPASAFLPESEQAVAEPVKATKSKKTAKTKVKKVKPVYYSGNKVIEEVAPATSTIDPTSTTTPATTVQ